MARSRFHRLDETKQERILEAAAQAFAERGYEGASLNRIIERSGISKGALYYYFEDKADLFSTVMEHAIERVMAETGGFPDLDGLTAADFWEVFRQRRTRAIEFRRRNPWWMKLSRSFYQFREHEEAQAAAERVHAAGRRWTRLLVERGQELGVIRTDVPVPMLVEVAMAMDGAADRWLLEHWDEYDDAELRPLLTAQFDLLRDVLDARHEGWDS